VDLPGLNRTLGQMRLGLLQRADPAVDSVTGFTGGGGAKNSAMMFIALKPLKERDASLDQILARLRPKLLREPGANLFLNPIQDLRAGGRQTEGSQQFTLRGDDLNELRAWGPKLEAALKDVPELTDVSSDQQDKGLQMTLIIDRPSAARLGITPRAIDTALNLAFGQAQGAVQVATPQGAQGRLALDGMRRLRMSQQELRHVGRIVTPAGKRLGDAQHFALSARKAPRQARPTRGQVGKDARTLAHALARRPAVTVRYLYLIG